MLFSIPIRSSVFAFTCAVLQAGCLADSASGIEQAADSHLIEIKDFPKGCKGFFEVESGVHVLWNCYANEKNEALVPLQKYGTYFPRKFGKFEDIPGLIFRTDGYWDAKAGNKWVWYPAAVKASLDAQIRGLAGDCAVNKATRALERQLESALLQTEAERNEILRDHILKNGPFTDCPKP
jgi:hypothetical protein